MRAWTPNTDECWPIRLEHPAGYSDLFLCSPEIGKVGRSQRSPTPEDHPNWGIKHNLFSDIRELVSIPEVEGEGQLYLHHPVSYGESNRAAEDSGMKTEEEGEAESSDGENPENWSGVSGVDQPVGYIVCFANVVKPYQRKNWNCFGCCSPDHLLKDCVKDLRKAAQKGSLNTKEWMMKKGGQTPQKPVVT